MGVLFVVVRLIDAFSDPIMGMMITDKSTQCVWPLQTLYVIVVRYAFRIGSLSRFHHPDLAYSYKIGVAYFSYILLTLGFHHNHDSIHFR